MEDQNGNVIANKTAPPLRDLTPEESDPVTKEEFTYGWGRIRPKCLQFLNCPAALIIVFCVYNMFQGIAAWGMTYLVLPSIERRFSFSSKELGVISASNDVTALLFVMFVSYYGDYGNKMKWMAAGAMTTGIGVLVFGLPHFMVGRYDPGNTHSGSLCDYGNATSTQCTANSGGEWYYLAVFVMAMLIMGVGSAPYFSLFNAYLDENVEPKSFPLYLGIFTVIQFIAPGIGFIIGGKFLSIYVDIKQPDGFNLTPRDPRWIGAWWMGFLIFGPLIVLCSFIMLGFPREMPGARKRRQKHVREGNIKPSNDVEKPSLRNLPSELKELLTNLTYLFNVLGMTSLVFFVGAVITFYAKILRMKFGVNSVQTGYIVAIISISGTMFGTLIGSIIVRMFSLKTACKKAAAVCVLSHLLACGGALIFMIPSCTNVNLAGLSVQYNNPYMNGTKLGELKSQCNMNCGCSLSSFSPVCGSNNVTYLDACHAGCTSVLADKTFANCSCIKSSNQSGSARPGYCDRDCKNLVTFVIITLLTSAIRFSTAVPTRTVLLRCVPDNKRAFASGISYVTTKTFALLPSPVVFGHIFDQSCRVWQNICGRRGRCFDYDITSLSRNIAFFGFSMSVLTTFFYFLSWYFCKSPKSKDVVCIENQGADKADETTL